MAYPNWEKEKEKKRMTLFCVVQVCVLDGRVVLYLDVGFNNWESKLGVEAQECSHFSFLLPLLERWNHRDDEQRRTKKRRGRRR